VAAGPGQDTEHTHSPEFACSEGKLGIRSFNDAVRPLSLEYDRAYEKARGRTPSWTVNPALSRVIQASWNRGTGAVGHIVSSGGVQ